jgi:hypothetical protein
MYSNVRHNSIVDSILPKENKDALVLLNKNNFPS